MNHIALNGAWTNEGHFNDQIIKFSGFKARQHIHLGAAFNLKHPDGISLLQHFINGGIFARHGGQLIRFTFMNTDEVKRFANAGENAQCQNIHLHHAQHVNIVFIPFDEVTILHGGGAYGHAFI